VKLATRQAQKLFSLKVSLVKKKNPGFPGFFKEFMFEND
jgi:hypothetical protein